MGDFVYHSTHFMLKAFDKIFKTDIKVSGVENICLSSPTLFVANHFTRVETVLLPYVIHQYSKKQIRSLADKSLFTGVLGSYLEEAGALSTAAQGRDDIIVADLISGHKNWLIYPEGNMVKNKNIIKHDEFIINVPDRQGSIHTGAAMLAMKSQLLRSQLRANSRDGEITQMEQIKERYSLMDSELSYHSTKITPINITYLPIRPGENAMMKMASFFMGDKEIPSMHEELEIEGNLLSNAQIFIHFSRPIDMAHYLHHAKHSGAIQMEQDSQKRDSNILHNFRHPLTTLMMDSVYKETLVTLEHLFCAILHHGSSHKFDRSYMKQLIYLIADHLKSQQIYRLHSDIDAGAIELLSDNHHDAFESILNLALSQEVLREDRSGNYSVDVESLKNEHTFHTIRLKNTILVIYNEIFLLDELKRCVDMVLVKDRRCVGEDIFYRVYRQDLAIFKQDYSVHYSVIRSKPKEIGSPFILYNSNFTTGILFSHGYKSAPAEIESLGRYLHERGYNFYGVRLKGHGTVSEDLRDSTYQQWCDSYERGYAALRQVSSKIILGGFSTGGLVALLSSIGKERPVDGIVCINTAIKLNDIRINYIVPTLNMFNDFLALFNADLKYIETEPENPSINYHKNYIKSIAQLKKLIEITNKNLKRVDAPILILQADQDPVVNPNSAKIIYDNISSKEKRLSMLKYKRHVITMGDRSVDIFVEIDEFVQKVLE